MKTNNKIDEVLLLTTTSIGSHYYYMTTVDRSFNKSLHVTKFTPPGPKSRNKLLHGAFSESMLIHAAAFVWRRYR